MSGPLPAGWALTTIGGIAQRVTKGTTPTTYGYSFTPEGVRFVKAESLNGLRIDHTSCAYVEQEAHDAFERSQLAENDVLITIAGTLGRVAVVSNLDLPANTNQAVAIIRLKDPALAQFVARYLSGAVYSGRGTGLQNLNLQQISEMLIPLPPLAAERVRIVDKTDRIFESSKSAQKELERIPNLIERYKQAILAKAFCGDLTADWRLNHAEVSFVPSNVEPVLSARRRRNLDEQRPFVPPYEIPQSWKWMPLSKLGQLDRGRSRHRPRNAQHLYGGPYPFIQTGDVKAGLGIVTTFTQTYSEAGLAQSRLWPKGTLCITIAANIAETAILGMDACFPDSIVGFLANEQISDPRYIEFFIRTVKADLTAFAPATAQKNINLETLTTLRVPAPPLPEQREILRRVQESFLHIDQVAADAARAMSLLDRLDQATLDKAFCGDLI
jgi:type I restriction enzyme S subunit